MAKYIIRLDDAAEKWNRSNWLKMEALLTKYKIRPVVGIIPQCEDPDMDIYNLDVEFADTIARWGKMGWQFALHGYNHVFISEAGGINPVNFKSEFAGVSLKIQKDKIRNGVERLSQIGVTPKIFFAPAHTFDNNTLIALKNCSDIEFISDTIAYDVYELDGFTVVPQQCGMARKLPFKVTTFCYHPNNMNDKDFYELENFLEQYDKQFIDFPLKKSNRKRNIIDYVFRWMYFRRRK